MMFFGLTRKTFTSEEIQKIAEAVAKGLSESV